MHCGSVGFISRLCFERLYLKRLSSVLFVLYITHIWITQCLK